MTLHVLGSSSSGNTYILTTADNHHLIIEAGIDTREVKKAINYRTSDILGVLVSHEHNDHAKYVNDYLRMGITTLALPEVFASHKSPMVFAKTIKPNQGYIIGGFKILPLPAAHDVPCVGFLITHSEMGRLFFLTDTMYSPASLPANLNHIMIECNYDDETLQYSIDNGLTNPGMRSRLELSHLELHNTIETLRTANPLPDNIILIHLSHNNCNPDLALHSVQQSFGVPTYIATPNLTLEL